MMINRRHFILSGGAISVAYAVGLLPTLFSRSALAESFVVNYTAEQWRQRLSASQYAVLREEGTEPPYSSPLNDEHRAGLFSCAGCDLPLFSSHTKFDSHTGWPSFWQPVAQAVATRKDRTLGMLREEVHCSRCGGHLGHVFDDGPQPTGLRYCMNGLALIFTPQ